MPPRARRRAIHPGRRMASGEEFVDLVENLDVAMYITPPMPSTARAQSVSTSGMAPSSRRGVPKAFPGPCRERAPASQFLVHMYLGFRGCRLAPAPRPDEGALLWASATSLRRE